MKIISAEIDQFSLDFKRSIKIGKEILNTRNGHYLKLRDQDNNIFYGELSPLPGLFNESLEEAKTQLELFIPKIINNMTLTNIDLELPFFGMIPSKQTFSSVFFSIEMALYSFLIKHQLIKVNLSKNLMNNKLYIPNDQTDEQYFKDIKCLKLKIGRQSVQKDFQLISKIIQLNPNIQLRLDGNCSFLPDDLIKLLKDIPKKNIEYLEEPLIDLLEWEEVWYQLQVPLALDESLPLCLSKNVFPKGTTTFIIKPQWIGGVSKTFKIMSHAQSLGLNSVISSSFESKIGIKFLEEIAKKQNFFNPVYSGLATTEFFKS